jgi:hypothetical protein
MRRPVRWLDEEMVSADVRGLLERAGRSRALPGEVRTRSIARLDRYLVWPAAAGLLLWLKGIAIAAGIAIVGVVAVAEIPPMVRPAPVQVDVAPNKPQTSAPMTMAPRATTAAAPASVAPTPAAPAVAPTAAPVEQDRTPPAKLQVPAPTTSAPAEPEVDPLTREAAMLERARASLDRDPRASLSELDACAATFPHGTLRIERELLAVDALTRVGNREEARRRGEALLSAARGSIYEPRVRTMLERLQAP